MPLEILAALCGLLPIFPWSGFVLLDEVWTFLAEIGEAVELHS